MKSRKQTGFVATAVLAVVAGLWMIGCANPQPAKPAGGAAAAPPGAAAAKAGGTNAFDQGVWEIIKVGDALSITFSDVSPLPLPFQDTVRGDGTIRLLMDKEFRAVGKRRGDLEREIHSFYVPDYYKHLTVTIAFKNQFYSVGGEVRSPNRFEFLGLTTVTRAIQSAGDFTDFARRRKVNLCHLDGSVEIVDCLEVLKNPSMDPQVRPGDTIKVIRRLWPWEQ